MSFLKAHPPILVCLVTVHCVPLTDVIQEVEQQRSCVQHQREERTKLTVQAEELGRSFEAEAEAFGFQMIHHLKVRYMGGRDVHKNRSKYLVGVGGWWGEAGLSVTGERQMGMASGESDIYFGTDVENWGAEWAGIFWPAEGKNCFLPHASILKMLRYSENRNMGGKPKKFRSRDPTSKSALGCWPIHLSPATCQLREGGRGSPEGDRPIAPPPPLVQATPMPE